MGGYVGSAPACYGSSLVSNPDISQKYKIGDISKGVAISQHTLRAKEVIDERKENNYRRQKGKYGRQPVGKYRETTDRKGTMGRNEDDRRERMRGDK
jgi:hypothetical protein